MLILSDSFNETIALTTTNHVTCDLGLSAQLATSEYETVFQWLVSQLPAIWLETTRHLPLTFSETQSFTFGVILLSNSEIQGLNQQFRHKDEPTDVLTFSMREAQSYQADLPEVHLGEIYLSLDWAKIQVKLQTDRVFKEHGNSSDPFVLFLVDRLIHGILHLLGVHHNTDEDYNHVIHIQRQVIYATSKTPS